MSDLMWKSQLDPQIAARNRWATRCYAGPEDLPSAADRTSDPLPRPWLLRSRSRAAAVTVFAVGVVIAFFLVVALHASAPQPQYVVAPAASATEVPSDPENAVPVPGHPLPR